MLGSLAIVNFDIPNPTPHPPHRHRGSGVYKNANCGNRRHRFILRSLATEVGHELHGLGVEL